MEELCVIFIKRITILYHECKNHIYTLFSWCYIVYIPFSSIYEEIH